MQNVIEYGIIFLILMGIRVICEIIFNDWN